MMTPAGKMAISQHLVQAAQIFDNESPGYRGGWLKKLPGTDHYIHWWLFRTAGERHWFPLFERLLTPAETICRFRQSRRLQWWRPGQHELAS